MNKLNKKEKLFTFQNFAIILLLMAIIYLIAFYFWNMYEETLRNQYYHPYIKINDSNYIRLKSSKYFDKNTSISINKTDIEYEYIFNSDYGTSKIKTFDPRFYFYENNSFSALGYPSYDFRGMEFTILFKNGEKIKYVVVPNEKILDEIEEITNNFVNELPVELSYLLNNNKYVSLDQDIISIKKGEISFDIYKNKIVNISQSDNYFYLHTLFVKDLEKIYIIPKNEEHNLIELINIIK
ncbi:hypothetical protein [Geotoga petraea]|uniref:Uncharacterized protein n=1 Tax=Geotoga petraea TaxID=28234 RepID=A0A1G6IJ07_9BACT|nr:hypothetical protein [Geotoga petraea]TGG89203.1 hypothetical protein E4650_03160 [Geotoga petraea]SDC05716.1 hypothetical protein SAMN04488588_0373 [Geotoga petraea]